MLDPNFVRNNILQVKAATQNKAKNPDLVDQWLDIDVQRAEVIAGLEELNRQKNELAEWGKQGKDVEDIRERGKDLKELQKHKQAEYDQIDQSWKDLLKQIPNLTSPDMPIGKDENDNKVIRSWGEIPKFDFELKDHVELGEELNLIDIETASKISGSRFYYLKNEAVLIQFGLVQLVMQTLLNKELMQELGDKVGHPDPGTFQPIIPPVLMRPEIMEQMDRLDPIDDRFQTRQDGLMLVGSAEHTLGPIHMNQTFAKEELPVRYVGYSPAFRREAGSYGRDTKGILRVHQFDKLEMETFVPIELGQIEQDFIVAIQEYLVQKLEIPYQVIHICTGDTGKPDYNQYDIECWIPTQEKYRETHTSDYMTDYQARRLNTKYVDQGNNKQYVHMNDATAFAITRILIAILENNQQADGSIRIPEALQSYVGKEVIEKSQSN